jgi:trehalose 6-phosphate phosphatase
MAALLNQVAAQLSPDLTSGVILENKGATASIHYRLAPDPDRARRELLDMLGPRAASDGFKVEEGRRVINLLPPLAVTKGSAVTWLVREHRLDGIVYLGDDVTDTHAFRALDVLRRSNGVRTLSIGVVGPETPASVRQHADASVPTVGAVVELLSGVLDGLKSSATMGSRAPILGSS